ncbi:MAG: competence/damage-inducible protein A [Sedimentisphaerales bacterium]|nr:competence/damage-inducible protein A [Sedimentisphaerales bacterium]
MNAIIISIGDELILGQTVDTNAAWLSRQLSSLGITAGEHITVGDDINAIVGQLRRAESMLNNNAADVVLVTGGLGPTDDDLTRHALAEVLETELKLHQPSLNRIEQFFVRLNKPMSQTNRVQAMIPCGCDVLENNVGTAPGITAQIGKTPVFFLPGVPAEMKVMFDKSVKDKLRQKVSAGGTKKVYAYRTLHTYGAGESSIAEMLGDMMSRGRNPVVNCTAAHSIVSIRIISRGADEKTARVLIEPVERELRKRLGTFIFGSDEDTLAGVVGGLLRRNGVTVAVAESCTGGLLAKELTDISGSSSYFMAGWVTYSNDAKAHFLQVNPKTLERYGAVSEQVACELARNACREAQTDYALSITGIAGPTGGIAGPTGSKEEKPVGLVYIGLADRDGVEVVRSVFPGSRDCVRRRAVYSALNFLRLRF